MTDVRATASIHVGDGRDVVGVTVESHKGSTWVAVDTGGAADVAVFGDDLQALRRWLIRVMVVIDDAGSDRAAAA